MKHELLLENLNCAHCASKIETKISETEGFERVSFNFATKKLSWLYRFSQSATALRTA